METKEKKRNYVLNICYFCDFFLLSVVQFQAKGDKSTNTEKKINDFLV